MIVFDTLDKFELYNPIFSKLVHVIDVMDRSLPYDQVPGEYRCPEDDQVQYKVEAFLSSNEGLRYKTGKGDTFVEIMLEGEAITSLDGDNVFKLIPGRFLLYTSGYEVHSHVCANLPVACKSVLFKISGTLEP